VQRTRRAANTLGGVFSVLGVLFMLAIAFGLFMPRAYALFLGVACFVVAPTFRRLSRSAAGGRLDTPAEGVLDSPG